MTQDSAYNLLKSGANVFLTGPAGSGKTFLLNKYLEYLKAHKKKVAITASTGIAATILNGQTIHSWSGIGIKEKLTKTQLYKLESDEKLNKKISKTDVLIIDEISMLSASRLDSVNLVCQQIRQNTQPFGGLQVVMAGDFFQLPPVVKNEVEDGSLACQADIWSKMNLKVAYLNDQFRQKIDDDLFAILKAMRLNLINSSLLEKLAGRLSLNTIDEKMTKLYSHNRSVDRENDLELDKINERSKSFFMTEKGSNHLVSTLKRSCLAPETLILKKGAIVMFVKNNFKKKYVNGTLGEVIGFSRSTRMPIVLTSDNREIEVEMSTWYYSEDDNVLASISQLPLRLAWAITIHKSQGMSLDKAQVDLGNTFGKGMAYVALSRLRSLSGLNLIDFKEKALWTDPFLIELDKRLRDLSEKV